MNGLISNLLLQGKIILISPKEEGIFWDTNGNCLNNGTELVIEGKAYNLTPYTNLTIGFGRCILEDCIIHQM